MQSTTSNDVTKETVNILGFKLSSFSKKALLKEVENSIISNRQIAIYGLCSGTLARVKRKKRELPLMLRKFDYLVADGASIPLFAKLCGIKDDIELIPITDLAFDLLDLCNNSGYRVLLLGASRAANDLATQRMRARFPNAVILDGIDGYFDISSIDKVISKINELSPDLLLIGMTYPLKEKLVYFYRDKISAFVILPCGGAIDVMAGITKRPNKLFKRIPVTWLYRWFQEPSRLSILPDINFLLLVIPVIVINCVLLRRRSFSLIQYHNINMQEEISPMSR